MESNSEKLERSNIQDVLDQTMIQKGMLFHYLNEDKSNLYNVQIALRLVGPLNENLFFKAIEKVQENNEVLRSVFDWEKIDKALQIILKQGQLKSKTYDLTAEKASDQLKLIQKILYHDQRKRFNLNQTPIRFLLLKCNKNEHIFVITHHHILYDGWSTGILLKELIDNYNHLNSEEALTKVKKPSYSEVVLKSIQAVNHDQQDDYWRQYLSGFSIGTGVPVTKSSADQEREVHKHSITLNAEKLNVFASENKITKASVLYSLYALLLHKYSGDEDVVFGITVSSRDPRVNGIDRLMGNFINSIPLRVSDIANRSFEEIAHQLQEDLKTHTPFFGTSLFEIKKILGLDPSENIFNSTVGIENYPLDKGLIDSIDGVAIDLYSLYENTNVDLALIVFIKDTLQVDFNYKGNKFDSGSIEILSRHFTKLLEKAIKEPSKKVKDLSLVSEQDIQMIEEFNKSEDGVEVSNHTYVSEFVSQSKRTPDHVAVVAGRESITYAELDQESDMVASYLATHAANEQYILLYCPISIEMIIAALGILKCGKAFVPLDPQMESDRSSNIIKQSRFGCLITNLKQKGELEFQGEVITWKRGDRKYEPYKGNEGRAESIAYLIYTSGTTGKPKGVKIKQSNLLNYSKWLQKYISLDPTCVSLLTSSFSFDLGYSSVFPVLISGGSVHMVNKDTYQNPDTLTSYIADHQITLLKLTPSLFSTFKEAENIYNNVLDSVETVLLGGESLHPEDIRSMSECYPSISFINHYGPTEATIGAIAHRIDNPHGVSEQIIGKPIAQNKVYILDNCNNIMPLGMQGQLCITGPGVGAGYLDDSKLTNEKFIKLGNAKYQLYKTGDLAKWLPNGTIQFLGREDRQVKIRGYRVELSEIEAKIASHPSVSEVAVLYLNNHLLVAYYVQKAELSHDELPEFLTKLLPDYMVPANFIRVDQIPLTANGKVDAKELSKIDYDNGPEYRSPTTELEKMLVMIWAEILGAERVGITDDFFTLGGDSIKSIQICSRVRRAGYELQVKEVLRYRTIQKISHRLKPRNVIADQSTIQGIADLTPIQRWLYESPIEHKDHYNQSVILEFDKIIDAITIDKIFTKLISHHDALRMRIVNVSDRWQIENLASDQYAEIIEVDLSGKKNKDKYQLEAANELQESIDVENGPLIKLCLFQDEGHCKLLIVVHHFVIDTISWRILVEDFNDLLNQVLKDEQLKLPLKTDAYLLWSTSLNEYINKKQHLESLDYWVSETQKQNEPLVRSGKPQINPIKTQTISRELDEQQTQRLLKGSGQYLKLEINDILLAALFLSMKETLGKNKMTIDLESHGREEAILNMDLSRTIGWFTTLFPFVFETSSTDTLMILRQLKDKLRKIPNGGLDYLLHRYYAKARSLKQQQSQIKFNYLGEFDFNKQAGNFHVTEDFKGLESNPEDWKGYDWEIVGLVRNNRLKLSISFVENWYDKSFVSSFLDSYQRQLMDVVEVCAHQTKRVLNPSDLTYSELSIQELDRLQQKYNIQDVYPLSPMQQGMLFHTLLNENAGHYNEQKMIAVTGKLNIDVFVKSLGDLVDSYPVLRTAFLHRDFEQPLQVVLSEREVNFEFIDLRDKMTDVEGEQLVESYCLKDQNINYDLEKDPLMKVTVLQLEDDRYKILWNHHHIMMDGWCMEMILQDVREFYRARLKNEQIVLPDPTPYSSYIAWLRTLNKSKSLKYWADYLDSYEHSIGVPVSKAGYTQRPYKHNTERLHFDPEETKRLKSFSNSVKITLNNIFTTIWGIVIAKYNNVDDAVFGMVVSGRPAAVDDVDKIIGLFINTIPVRIQFNSNQTVLGLFDHIQQKALESEPHHYQSLAEIFSAHRLGDRLFDHFMVFEKHTVLNYQNHKGEEDSFWISDYQRLNLNNNYDFWIRISAHNEIDISFEYNVNRFDSDLISSLAACFK
ncbi:amino acid adenylation domain-containing protein, partial [Fulvivirga sp.]